MNDDNRNAFEDYVNFNTTAPLDNPDHEVAADYWTHGPDVADVHELLEDDLDTFNPPAGDQLPADAPIYGTPEYENVRSLFQAINLPSLDGVIDCEHLHPHIDKLLHDMGEVPFVEKLTPIQLQMAWCCATDAVLGGSPKWKIRPDWVDDDVEREPEYVLIEDEIRTAVAYGVALALFIYPQLPRK